MATVTTPVPIRVHWFPSTVTFADGRVIDPAKVLVGRDRLWVFQNSGSSEPTLIGSWLLDDIYGSMTKGYTAIIDGAPLTIRRSGHCGCGMGAFRSWTPFPIQSVMSPMPSKPRSPQ